MFAASVIVLGAGACNSEKELRDECKKMSDLFRRESAIEHKVTFQKADGWDTGDPPDTAKLVQNWKDVGVNAKTVSADYEAAKFNDRMLAHWARELKTAYDHMASQTSPRCVESWEKRDHDMNANCNMNNIQDSTVIHTISGNFAYYCPAPWPPP